jgi:hypothetical protein
MWHGSSAGVPPKESGLEMHLLGIRHLSTSTSTGKKLSKRKTAVPTDRFGEDKEKLFDLILVLDVIGRVQPVGPGKVSLDFPAPVRESKCRNARPARRPVISLPPNAVFTGLARLSQSANDYPESRFPDVPERDLLVSALESLSKVR